MTSQKYLTMKNCITDGKLQSMWFTASVQTENSASNWTDSWRETLSDVEAVPCHIVKTETFSV